MLTYTQVETIDYMQYLIIRTGTLQIAIRKWWLNINGEIVQRKSIGSEFDSIRLGKYVYETMFEEEMKEGRQTDEWYTNLKYIGKSNAMYECQFRYFHCTFLILLGMKV